MGNIEKFLKQQAYNVYYGQGDTDHPTCPNCNSIMNFHGGKRDFGNGYWDCSNCDFTFSEDDLNNIDF